MSVCLVLCMGIEVPLDEQMKLALPVELYL